ncbi:MAG: hypothetical protein V3U75_11265 [Methylococcaceae bacterium]
MKRITKKILTAAAMLMAINASAQDYCKMYGENDVLCESQRMQRNKVRYPTNMQDAQIAIDRVKRLIEICDDGKGDVSACYTLCDEGVHYDVCSSR